MDRQFPALKTRFWSKFELSMIPAEHKFSSFNTLPLKFDWNIPDKTIQIHCSEYCFAVGWKASERVVGESEKGKILPLDGAPIGTQKCASTNYIDRTFFEKRFTFSNRTVRYHREDLLVASPLHRGFSHTTSSILSNSACHPIRAIVL